MWYDSYSLFSWLLLPGSFCPLLHIHVPGGTTHFKQPSCHVDTPIDSFIHKDNPLLLPLGWAHKHLFLLLPCSSHLCHDYNHQSDDHHMDIALESVDLIFTPVRDLQLHFDVSLPKWLHLCSDLFPPEGEGGQAWRIDCALHQQNSGNGLAQGDK